MERTYEKILDRAAAERGAAPERLKELLKQPLSERLMAIATKPRFQTHALAVYILEKSETVVFHQPRAALELTRLARAVTSQIDPRTCGGREALADLAAYTLAKEGNVQRVCGEMGAALMAFARAREAQKYGGVDSQLEAKISVMEASLRRDLGQLHRALSLLDRATAVFLELSEPELWSQAQVNRSNVFQVREDFDKAATILEDAMEKASTPYTLLCIRHNLIHLLACSGRPCEAARLLEKSRGLFQWLSDPLSKSRRLWVEGLIACGLGEEKLAEHLLDEAGSSLDERGYAFDAALARLDLGKLRARRRAEPVC
jgi:tetratricopeptide (TPR) repeat protein